MIVIKNLIKNYGQTSVLKGVDLHVKKGDVYGFIGKNGAGKSTTMNMITGLIPISSGEIHISEGIKIGYLPESPQFYDYMTGVEYLRFLGELSGQKKHIIQEKTKELLKLVGLTEHGKKPIKNFSRGMQQRFGIACVLYHNPDILLLDEPSSALDPQGRKEILDLILVLKEQGKTIFLSTHILSDLEKVCDRVGILNDGKIVLEDSMVSLLNIEDHYEIITSSPETDFPYLKTLSNIKTVVFNNQKFIIETNSNSTNLFKELALLPITVLSYVKLKPTLEDVFIKAVNPCPQ